MNPILNTFRAIRSVAFILIISTSFSLHADDRRGKEGGSDSDHGGHGDETKFSALVFDVIDIYQSNPSFLPENTPGEVREFFNSKSVRLETEENVHLKRDGKEIPKMIRLIEGDPSKEIPHVFEIDRDTFPPYVDSKEKDAIVLVEHELKQLLVVSELAKEGDLDNYKHSASVFEDYVYQNYDPEKGIESLKNPRKMAWHATAEVYAERNREYLDSADPKQEVHVFARLGPYEEQDATGPGEENAIRYTVQKCEREAERNCEEIPDLAGASYVIVADCAAKKIPPLPIGWDPNNYEVRCRCEANCLFELPREIADEAESDGLVSILRKWSDI